MRKKVLILGGSKEAETRRRGSPNRSTITSRDGGTKAQLYSANNHLKNLKQLVDKSPAILMQKTLMVGNHCMKQ
jgi:hypothetical protein